ncbi:hypothetical protein [Metabacillus sp. 84]|uniref:hypothetical protein n=1 Tax=unclassified Metabacillus TaxID=2675274 RepID=UPI003CEFD897
MITDKSYSALSDAAYDPDEDKLSNQIIAGVILLPSDEFFSGDTKCGFEKSLASN